MLTRVTSVLAGVLLAACSPSETPEQPAANPGPAAPAAEGAAAATQPAPAGGLTPTPAPAGAAVYFIEPVDGATVTSPVRVVFGLSGAGVAPAGVEQQATGHHHLLVDAGMPPAGLPIPTDDNHHHFGGGQTETELMLEAGQHTLQLLFADYLHVPHDPPVASQRITINVE